MKQSSGLGIFAELVQLGRVDPVGSLGKLLEHFILEVAVRAYATVYVWNRTVLEVAVYLAVNGDGCFAFELIQQGVGNQFGNFCFRVRHPVVV